MIYGEYMAKSNPCETIQEHTDNLLKAFENIIKAYPNSFDKNEQELIKCAAIYHDAGKSNYAFQKKIHKAAAKDFAIDPALEKFYYSKDNEPYAEIPHGYLSSAFLPLASLSFSDEEKKILISAIYFHHTRSAVTDEQVVAVINNDLKPKFQNLNIGDDKSDTKITGDLKPKSRALNGAYLTRVLKSMEKNEGLWLKFAVVKGALNRLDYSASAHSFENIEIQRLQDGLNFDSWVRKYMEKNNFILRPVQKYMLEHKDENLIVRASTGIGKTEAACLWSGGEKLFYTLPMQVSINAMYQRFKVEYGFENCALLHSNALSIFFLSEEQPYLYYKQSKALSFPVTISTVDQLFTFVYKYRGCEIIPSVLKYSKIVIDEMQAYSPEIAAKIIYGLKLITMLGGHFAIITATMPPVLSQFIKEKGIEFSPMPQPFLNQIDRHKISYEEADFNFDFIACEGTNKKVLIICNTVKKAVAAYEALCERGCDVHLLHSHFQRGDRRKIEQALIDFSKGENCGIWVSTQIVEASLDVDFDMLFTEMCSADSLLQRLGRCYRKRKYLLDTPNVYIYDTKNGRGTIYDQTIYDYSVKFLQEYNKSVFTEKAKNEYIDEVYNFKRLQNSEYYKKLETNYYELTKLLPDSVDEALAKKQFREIISTRVISDETYEKICNNGQLNAITQRAKSKDILENQKAENELLDYTISINPNYSKNKIDKSPINLSQENKHMPLIYRIQAGYDFDEDTLKGKGLIFDKDMGANIL
ncbi:MAG: CRISPR-associated helicase Cas3' [Oscillospiraceae bacterium]